MTEIRVDLREIYDGIGTVDGGNGDDRIEIETEVGSPFFGRPSVGAMGGAGADTFVVHVERADVPGGSEDARTTTSTGATIGDFDPSEDRLIVEVDGSLAQDDDDIGAELGEDDFGNSGLTLTFAGAEYQAQSSATTRLGSNAAGATLDDITIVRV